MTEFPYRPVEVAWKRPPIDRDIFRRCTRRNDLAGLLHCLGILALLGTTGAFSYYMFASQRWLLLALGLYVHGGIFAFNPQTHELAHGTLFKRRWLNSFFKRVFGLLHWTSNSALYWMSHQYHHRYTTHRASDGEVVLPRPETTERILQEAVRIVDVTGLLITLYDQFYAIFKPFARNTRRGVWQRYVYAHAIPGERRDAEWTRLSQFLFHVLFAVLAISIDRWFLIVVVSLPAFYGGKWYALWVHDTMHVGRQPETDDFRLCCRTVRLDPFTSFLYWHMEYHTEHHAFIGIPCYRLKSFHRQTRQHWDKPQSLVEAWREMNRHSEDQLSIPSAGAESERQREQVPDVSQGR